MLVFGLSSESKASHTYAKSITYNRFNANMYDVTYTVTVKGDDPENDELEVILFAYPVTINGRNNLTSFTVRRQVTDVVRQPILTQECGCSKFDNLTYKSYRFQGRLTIPQNQSHLTWVVFDDDDRRNPNVNPPS